MYPEHDRVKRVGGKGLIQDAIQPYGRLRRVCGGVVRDKLHVQGMFTCGALKDISRIACEDVGNFAGLNQEIYDFMVVYRTVPRL